LFCDWLTQPPYMHRNMYKHSSLYTMLGRLNLATLTITTNTATHICACKVSNSLVARYIRATYKQNDDAKLWGMLALTLNNYPQKGSQTKCIDTVQQHPPHQSLRSGPWHALQLREPETNSNICIWHEAGTLRQDQKQLLPLSTMEER
jgi:hypothetical protein